MRFLEFPHRVLPAFSVSLLMLPFVNGAEQVPPVEGELGVNTVLHTDDDNDSGVGSVGLSSGEIDLKGVRFEPGWGRLEMDLTWTLLNYDFDGDAIPSAGSGGIAVDNVSDVGLTVFWSEMQDKLWNWYAIGGIGSATEDGADFSDGLNYIAGLGGYHEVSPGLFVGLGVLYFSELEDSDSIIPVPFFRWQIDPNWVMYTANGVTVERRATPGFPVDIRVDALYEGTEFRLSSDNMLSDGVLEDNHVRLGVTARYDVGERFYLSSGLSVYPWREMELRDSSGNVRGSEELDAGFSISLGGGLRF